MVNSARIRELENNLTQLSQNWPRGWFSPYTLSTHLMGPDPANIGKLDELIEIYKRPAPFDNTGDVCALIYNRARLLWNFKRYQEALGNLNQALSLAKGGVKKNGFANWQRQIAELEHAIRWTEIKIEYEKLLNQANEPNVTSNTSSNSGSVKIVEFQGKGKQKETLVSAMPGGGEVEFNKPQRPDTSTTPTVSTSKNSQPPRSPLTDSQLNVMAQQYLQRAPQAVTELLTEDQFSPPSSTSDLPSRLSEELQNTETILEQGLTETERQLLEFWHNVVGYGKTFLDHASDIYPYPGIAVLRQTLEQVQQATTPQALGTNPPKF